MIKLYDEKVSAKEWARRILLSDLQSSASYYNERNPDEFEKMTEKEKEEISNHMKKYYARISKILGENK